MTDDPQHNLLMLWLSERSGPPPAAHPPTGYRVRLFGPSDRETFFDVQLSVGWITKEGEWQALMASALPDGIFLAEHAESGEAVATIAALRGPAERQSPLRDVSEIGWLAVAPAHRRRGLGLALCAAAMHRLVADGAERIFLRTQVDLRPPIRSYLQLGFRPFIPNDQSELCWRDFQRHHVLPLRTDEWIRLGVEAGDGQGSSASVTDV